MDVPAMHAALNQHDPFYRHVYTEKATGTPMLEWFDNAFADTIDAYANALETKAAYVAPIWHKLFNSVLFSPIVGLRLTYNCVPVIAADDVYITIGEDHRVAKIELSNDVDFYCLGDASIASSPKAITVNSQQDLDTKLVEVIVAMASLLEHHFKTQKVGSKLYWGAIHFAFGVANMRLSNQVAKVSSTLVDTDKQDQWYEALSYELKSGRTALNSINRVEYGTFQKIYLRRETCCLRYKIDGRAKCATCNLIPPAEQREQALSNLINAHSS